MDLPNLLMTKLFENSMEAMFFFDREGKALAMNPAAENIVDKDILKQLYQEIPRLFVELAGGIPVKRNCAPALTVISIHRTPRILHPIKFTWKPKTKGLFLMPLRFIPLITSKASGYLC